MTTAVKQQPQSQPSQAWPSQARRRSRLAWILLLIVLLAGVSLMSIAIGTAEYSVRNALSVLTMSGDDPLLDANTRLEHLHIIVHEQRLPRTVLGIVVGMALGIAGALIQGHTRNPLADPGILGISSGAALAVVLTVFVVRANYPLAYTIAALLGALVGALIVFVVSSLGAGGRTHPLSLILAGAALNAFFGAVVTFIVLTDRASLEQLRLWNAGSVSGRGYDIILTVLPFTAVGAVCALAQGPILNLLATGSDTASLLGVNVHRARIVGLIAIVLLAGGATAAAGPIGFVGLVVPHVARMLVGADYRWLGITSGLCGAILVIAGDIVGRIMVRPAELQVGIVLALVGAPFFILLVRQRRKLVAL